MSETTVTFVLAARAPAIGIRAFASGNWCIIATATENAELKRRSQEMVGFLHSIGGECALLMVSPPEAGRPRQVRVIVRQLQTATPPRLGDLVPLSDEDKRAFAEMVGAHARPTMRARAAANRWIPTRRDLARGMAASLVIGSCLFGAFVFARDGTNATAAYDHETAHLSFLRSGGMEVVKPSIADPLMMEVVRLHPDGRREVLERFRTRDFERSGGYVPKPRQRYPFAGQEPGTLQGYTPDTTMSRADAIASAFRGK